MTPATVEYIAGCLLALVALVVIVTLIWKHPDL